MLTIQTDWLEKAHLTEADARLEFALFLLSTSKISLAEAAELAERPFEEMLHIAAERGVEFVIEPKPMPKKVPKAGFFKGKIWMSDDFNEPLEDFKDYM